MGVIAGFAFFSLSACGGGSGHSTVYNSGYSAGHATAAKISQEPTDEVTAQYDATWTGNISQTANTDVATAAGSFNALLYEVGGDDEVGVDGAPFQFPVDLATASSVCQAAMGMSGGNNDNGDWNQGWTDGCTDALNGR